MKRIEEMNSIDLRESGSKLKEWAGFIQGIPWSQVGLGKEIGRGESCNEKTVKS